MSELPEIPESMLPVPSIVIWHGELETAGELENIELIQSIYQAFVDSGTDGIRASGNDWIGWHLASESLIQYLYSGIYKLAKPNWKVQLRVEK